MKIDYMQLEFIDLNLRKILQDIEKRFGEKTITSLFRIDDSGVHGTLPLRGIDLRCKTLSHGELIEDWVNKRWQYDLKRKYKKCCLFHTVGKGYHIHLQSHPNTERI